MTRWWWVRHGPTHEKAFCGWRDVPADLSDAAVISRLKAYLPKTAVVVSSDLIRAVATADAITGQRQRLPHAPQIREFNFGDWDGLDFDQVAERDPQLSRDYWENPGDSAPPNGESWHDLSTRIAPFVADMNARFAGQDIIAVAHIGVIMTQVGMAANLPPSNAIGHQIGNLSVTQLNWNGLGWDVVQVNHNP